MSEIKSTLTCGKDSFSPHIVQAYFNSFVSYLGQEVNLLIFIFLLNSFQIKLS